MVRKTSQRRISVTVRTPEKIQEAVRRRLRPILGPSLQARKEKQGDRWCITGVIEEDSAAPEKLKNVDRALKECGRQEAVASPLIADLEIIERRGRPGFDEKAASIRIGKRFMVFPNGEISASSDDRIALPITGFNAFGDGTHPSTTLALHLLEHVMEGRHGGLPSEGWILDAGCGTGILGLAASALGNYDVLGIDISAEAMAAARVNRRQFGAHGRKVQYVQGGFQCARGPFFLVLANLVASVHTGAHRSFWAATTPGGWLILTGFSSKQKGLVTGPYLRRGAKEKALQTKAGWAGIVLTKPKENMR